MIEIDVDFIKRMVANNRRIDNRGFEDYRNIVIEHDIVSSAEGSARVKIGKTEVIAGVKMSITEPYPDTPDEGSMMVVIEFVPFASPEFEAGPPKEDSVEISRIVDRVIRESKAIDFKKLCINPKEKVWFLYVDIDVINDDGNLIDAACIAGVSALLNAKIPNLDKDGNPDYTKKGSKSVPINGVPVATTFVKIGNNILVDPVLGEFQALDARLTVGTVKVDNEIKYCAMQKGGISGFTVDEIEGMLDLAAKKSEEIRKKLE